MTTMKSDGMNNPASLSTFSLTRRGALQAALAVTLLPRIIGTSGSVAAQETASGVWNWGGNAGHTGELPGPGLDLDSPLGELWRISGDEFWSGGRYSNKFAGYANGVIYTINGDSLWARRLSDGAFLWAQSPAKLLGEATPPQSTPSARASATPFARPPATPVPASLGFELSAPVAIHDGVILVPVGNGRIWGLDAATGELRWDSVGGSYDPRFDTVPPTIVGDLAFSISDQGISAVRLTDPPTPQWLAEWDVDAWLLGADSEFVYAMTSDWRNGVRAIRALTLSDGTEYWRANLEDDVIGYVYNVGVTREGVVLFGVDRDSGQPQTAIIDRNGQIAWNKGGASYSYLLWGWALDGVVLRAVEQRAQNDYYRLESFDAASGNTNWTLDLDTNRWYTSNEPVMCAGKAYAFARDRMNGSNVLLIIDPRTGNVRGAWDLPAIPILVADGVLIALDDDTLDVFAIGPVSPVLQAGGRAVLGEDATLHGAPSDSAIERAQLTAGTVVLLTGPTETSNGADWAPVTDQATGQSGWLRAAILSGQDGPISFAPIDVLEFGRFTSSIR